MEKNATSYRLTESALRLLQALAEKLGITRAAVIEIAVRDLAKKNGVAR